MFSNKYVSRGPWRVIRNNDNDNIDVFVLSAKYHLINAKENIIQPYELLMDNVGVDEVKNSDTWKNIDINKYEKIMISVGGNYLKVIPEYILNNKKVILTSARYLRAFKEIKEFMINSRFQSDYKPEKEGKMKKKKVVAIVSGGMDSITMLHHIAKEYDVEVLSFNYGSNHNHREIPLVAKHCELLGLKHKIIDLPLNNLFRSSLLEGADAIPEGHYAAENMKSTVIPFRNGIMLSVAVGYAENIGAKYVFLGSHKGDHDIYPDCRVKFTEAISKAAFRGTYNKVKIISPFNELMKWDIVSRGIELKVPYELTWSCYKGQNRPCLKCGTCIERIEAFHKNGIKDPLLTDEEWEQAVINLGIVNVP